MRIRHFQWKYLIAACMVLGLALVVPVQQAQAHALPTAYSPAPNAVLQVPPTQIRITFSEQLDPVGSRIIVVNPANQQVDNRDSHILPDAVTMVVALPLLQAGTYVVAWRTTSAQDGHVAGGSYIFHIARADGTVPPLTGKLPSGTSIGGGGIATNTLDAPTIINAFGRWFSLLMLTLILGLIFWQVVVLPTFTPDTATQKTLSVRFCSIAGTALEFLLIATIVEAGAEIVRISGSLNGIFSPVLLAGVLFQSHYGQFIVARLILAALAIFVLESASIRSMVSGAVLQGILMLFGIGLSLVVEYSGHGATGTAAWGPMVDLLHLLANGIWLGGLFVLTIVLVPFLQQMTAGDANRIIARGFVAFSLPALVSVILLIVTGPLNATQRMTGFSQMWTTAYGIVLLIKIVMFAAMIAISFWHAFRLRPLLAQAINIPMEEYAGIPGHAFLKRATQRFETLAAMLEPRPIKDAHLAMIRGSVMPVSVESPDIGMAISHASPKKLHPLSLHIFQWVRMEAVLGAGILLCAALLGPLAGTLSTTPTSASYGATGGAQTLIAKVDGISVTLHLDPGTFGSNTFTVTAANPDGTPVVNGTIFLLTTMVEMDMGQNEIDLHASSKPGIYAGQGDLPMAGHWKIETVIRTNEDPTHLHRVTFTVSAGF